LRLFYLFGQVVVRAIGSVLFGYKVSGREHIPSGGVLIASNHLSILDPPLLAASLPPNLYFFAKAELFSNKLFARLITALGAFPVERGGLDREAWKNAKRVLTSGNPLLFFPEGTRSVDGRLQPAKPGMARLALAAGVPVVPAVIAGSSRLGAALLRQVKLRVGFGRPVYCTEFDHLTDRQQRCRELPDRVMTEIGRLQQRLA
jgi:1-acyl-sn-glycerol-3-phosphate acyltransferase